MIKRQRINDVNFRLRILLWWNLEHFDLKHFDVITHNQRYIVRWRYFLARLHCCERTTIEPKYFIEQTRYVCIPFTTTAIQNVFAAHCKMTVVNFTAFIFGWIFVGRLVLISQQICMLLAWNSVRKTQNLSLSFSLKKCWQCVCILGLWLLTNSNTDEWIKNKHTHESSSSLALHRLAYSLYASIHIVNTKA